MNLPVDDTSAWLSRTGSRIPLSEVELELRLPGDLGPQLFHISSNDDSSALGSGIEIIAERKKKPFPANRFWKDGSRNISRGIF